jgi:hypothetical protein
MKERSYKEEFNHNRLILKKIQIAVQEMKTSTQVKSFPNAIKQIPLNIKAQKTQTRS